jgi:hypothetical protein
VVKEKMKKQLLILTLVFAFLAGYSQYPPPVGQPGSTAIHKDSSVFVDWSNDCQVVRGLLDIAVPSGGNATFGYETSGNGKADNQIVSLGDSGYATLTFQYPVYNGPGWDFAVFENGFSDDFLELGFVEVSSNGTDFYRFNAISITSDSAQVASYGTLDATKVHNFAGKYRSGYGTPFDLQELDSIPGLDINNITHVRIVDVIGTIDTNYCSFDSEGNPVNDPYPTAFPNGGFDLDAVGVIHSLYNSVIEVAFPLVKVYPNPFSDFFNIISIETVEFKIINAFGKTVFSGKTNQQRTMINLPDLPEGVYFLYIKSGNKSIIKKLIKQ